jgi:thioredoxin-like negative regulator of GroEL
MRKAPLWLLLFAHTAAASSTTMKLRPFESRREVKNLDGELRSLAEAVEHDPKNRTARLRLVQSLRRAGRFEEALREAKAWRAIDAYNLVVVRLIGDLDAELGRTDDARRAYSAVVELVPNDAQAQRALATVLKQGGDLDAAYARLMAAEKLKPDDRRIAFELADTAHRLGKTVEARTRFERIAQSTDQLAYPARQRLQQILGAELRRADAEQAKALHAQIDALQVAGGLENDIKIYLTWDTDRSDVDLWVTSPSGEKIFYGHKVGKDGESLHDDVTTGYGPESFTANQARPGRYTVEVNYFSGGRSEFDEARGEVVVVLHEGQPNEERHVLPYRLFEPKQTVTVAEIDVRGAQ